VYAPQALLAVSGNGQIRAALIVKQLQLSGNAASTLTAEGSGAALGAAGTAGQLLAGDLVVYVDNRSGAFTAAQLARIDDAIDTINRVINPFAVAISETTDPAEATTVLQFGATSAVGGAADGVLGCESEGNVTIVTGWDW